MKTPGTRTVAVLGASFAVLAGLDLFGLWAGTEHHGGIWNSVPLGDVALGMLGAGGLIWFSKRVLKRCLTRSESYYDGDSQT